MAKSPESIQKTIKQVYRLSIDPGATEHERAAAQKKLDSLLRRHNMTLEKILQDEKREKREFKTRFQWQKTILLHVIVKITNNPSPSKWTPKGSGNHTRCWYELTLTEYVDAQEAYKFYCAEFQHELDDLLSAFVNKHHLFADESPSSETVDLWTTPEGKEKLKRVMALRDALRELPSPLQKQLKGKA